MNGHLYKIHEILVEQLHWPRGILNIYYKSTRGRHRLPRHLASGRLHLLVWGRLHLGRSGRRHLLGRGRRHLLGLGGQGWRHLLGLGGWGRRHLLPSPLPGWLASRHALAWERRSSWIHFLVTGDGGAKVFLVPWLTKFLAGQDLYWQDGEPSGTQAVGHTPRNLCPLRRALGHKKNHVATRRRVTVHILFKIPNAQLLLWVVRFLKNYELFVFLSIFRCYFMGPNFLGK
jgi:hypothetical protein